MTKKVQKHDLRFAMIPSSEKKKKILSLNLKVLPNSFKIVWYNNMIKRQFKFSKKACCSLLFRSSRAQRHTSRKGWVASFSALTWRLPRIPTRIGGTHFQVVHPVRSRRGGMMAPSFVFLSFLLLLVLGLAAYLLQNFMDNTVVKPQKMDEICRSNSVLHITLGCTII